MDLDQLGFGLEAIYIRKKIQLTTFFAFLSCVYVLKYSIPGGVSTCKILTFQDQYFQKYKAQNIVKFSFFCLLSRFFKIFALKTYIWHFEDVPIKCPKQFLHYLSSYGEGHVQKNSSLNFMSLVGFQTSKNRNIFWKIFLWSQF